MQPTPTQEIPLSVKSSEKKSPQSLEIESSGAPSSHNQELGRRGEQAALRFLEKKGFYIHECNWRCPIGEIDIIAEDDEALAFIEVKTRSNEDRGLPEEAITAKKRKKYERLAISYLATHDIPDTCVRFDVISILAINQKQAFLRYHRDAFSVGEN